MQPHLLSIIKRCIACHFETVDFKETHFVCGNCSNEYQFDEQGILLAISAQNQKNLPALYHSADYQAWQKEWPRIAEKWFIYANKLFRFFSMSGHRKVKKYLRKNYNENDIIVDLGCGAGQLLEIIHHPNLVVVDRDVRFLKILKKRYPHVFAIQADILNMPFATHRLNCVMSMHTLEHLYFLAESLEEIQRIVHPSGHFLFSIPTEGSISWSLGRNLITRPILRKKYNLDANKIMAIEHINDAKRVLKFLNFYFKVVEKSYGPFSLLPFMGVNSSINGVARPL